MQHKFLNGVQTFAPESRNELIDYAFENKSMFELESDKVVKLVENPL